ncbi:hypothetical protein COCMIDRAFT_29251 [Bipolaris oryzae ATCC 44560]|uniref:Xylanolytic transcriptional activator regulatory domain-containing protein n=1 Tax=Bipolaris oryzae ATCC 44560 TaxID=930090 RepID=W6YX19_COCMI|nr:uncharacterized protein COCMIDRAFT_29251 [Bipolaris oryzae ATCC 44560]EUC42068.1 hypothetical protein COCMIDRAFT_29251 [Bipolaris oryzae ATCC 44560]
MDERTGDRVERIDTSDCTYSEEAEAHRQQSVHVSTLSNTEPAAENIVGTAASTQASASCNRASPEPRDAQVGNLFRSRDAPSFFGSSYFGPQAAAKIIEEPAPDLSSGIRHASASAQSFRDVGGPFSQIWDLLGILPRNKASVDRLVDVFIVELNWTIDAIHPASFKTKYAEFWERKFGFDDYASIDLRWLALLFIILAYGVFLDCPHPKNAEVQRDLQETSLRFYWASRRAIVIAPTFYGESTDLVRAGVLVTRYLIHMRRVPESWLTTSFAMRMAQAQGMHIDGERWRLPRKETETRRRLWSHLYTLDKTIALAIGRPFAIVDQQCLVQRATNVWLDDEPEEYAAALPVLPLSEPTLSVYNFLAHDLAKIIGNIQERCFGLSTSSYDTVLSLDREILEWAARLPEYFRIKDSDTSQDCVHSFIPWNRLYLHSMYHFARVTLHRPYLLRQSITNRFRHSHDACISSACADLAMRLDYLQQPLHDRLKWSLGPHHLFNSALVLGIVAVKDPHSYQCDAILEDLTAYCDMQRGDIWLNEFALAEVKIIELCIKKSKQFRENRGSSNRASTSLGARYSTTVDPPAIAHAGERDDANNFVSPETIDSSEAVPGLLNFGAGGPFQWQAPPWGDPSTDLQQWEHVLDSITQEQMTFGFQ